MVGAFHARHGSTPGTSEIRSWENSLTTLAEVLRDSRLADSAMAVRAAGLVSGSGGGTAGGADAHGAAAESDDVAALSTEYHLPLDNRRIDVLLFGHDAASRPHALALELKQWSTCEVEDEHALNVLVGGQHPARSRSCRLHSGPAAASRSPTGRPVLVAGSRRGPLARVRRSHRLAEPRTQAALPELAQDAQRGRELLGVHPGVPPDEFRFVWHAGLHGSVAKGMYPPTECTTPS
jgi:hypothetical protein